MVVSITQRWQTKIVVFRLKETLLVFKCHRLLQSLCVMDEYERINHPPPSSVIAAKPKCTSDGDRLMLKSERCVI